MSSNASEHEMSQYLWDGGWLRSNSGWWHPPGCLASWPIREAYAMAKRDEAKGLRLSPDAVAEYREEMLGPPA